MPSKRFLIWLLAIILMLLLATLLWYRHLNAATQIANAHTTRINQVVLATAKTEEVPVYLSALGAVIPTQSVTVRTQISGYLLRVLFQEGQTVKAGDILAEIDPQTYQAQLMQFEGQLARDQALLTNAQTDLQRYKKLYPQGGVSEQTYATQVSLVKQLEGTVKFDQGQVEGAKVNLAYCQIKSPINGRVGLRLVDPGNLVQTADTTGIAVVNTVQPISVVFSLPEDNVPQVMTQINAGKVLTVEAYDRTQNKLLATGNLLTIDNQIDPTTGTIKLKAEFANGDASLFPNQFVNVKLLVDTLYQATVIPTAAVQRGAQGDFVFVAKEGDTVNLKNVMLGVTFADNVVIKSGVLPGEHVVIEGADKLTDGAKVRVAQKK